MTALLDLAARVEAAAGPDRELDRDIARLIGWHRVEPRFTRGKHGAWIAPEDFSGVMSDGSPILDSLHGTVMHRDVPAFTTSPDSALSLVPKGLGVSVSRHGKHGDDCEAHVGKSDSDARGNFMMDTKHGEGKTMALAVCIAALRARATS